MKSGIEHQAIPDRRASLVGAIAIVVLTVIAYLPAIVAGGFIWDDDDYVTGNPYLGDAAGLVQLWVPGNTHQYYPVVFTTFWIEHQVWGLDATGYHVVNVLLHIANALLLWRIMVLLNVPGAWFIAAVFALHPVHAESVAWITERKNVLSGMFYFLAALCYLRFDPMRGSEPSAAAGTDHSTTDRPAGTTRPTSGPAGTARPTNASAPVPEGTARRGLYVLALLFFTAALLSKSVTCSLPAALILVMLYRRAPFTIRRLLPLAPMFLLGLAAAMHTAYLERASVGAVGAAFDYSFMERCLIASRALLFYPWKILVPYPLMFVYPRWAIDPGDVMAYWPLAAVIAIAALALIAFFRGTRGPAIALAFYAGTIFPALGFFNVYPHLFSFVADHFQYLASIGIIALIVAALARWIPPRAPQAVPASLVLATMAVLTMRQSALYQDAETIWRDTISKNDEAWLAHNNLASLTLRRIDTLLTARPDARVEELAKEARQHALRTVELKPDHDRAHVNLAEALRLLGRYEEAIAHQEKAIALLLERMRRDRRRRPPPYLAVDYYQLGRLQELLGREAEAVDAYRASIAIRDDHPLILNEFGRLLVALGRLEEAAEVYEKLVALNRNDFSALGTLAALRERLGKERQAEALYREAFLKAPSRMEQVQFVIRLIRLLATADDPEVRRPEEAIALAEQLAQTSGRRDPAALGVLASVYAEAGRMEEAIATAEEAVSKAEALGMESLAEQIRGRLEEYRTRRVDEDDGSG